MKVTKVKGAKTMKSSAGETAAGSAVAEKLYNSDNPTPAAGSGFRAVEAKKQETKERAKAAERAAIINKGRKRSMQSTMYPDLGD